MRVAGRMIGEPRACIIGAGACGIVAAKTFHEQGIPFDCVEAGSGIGGLWRYNNDSQRSAAYKSLHINSSRERMAFSGFPMPASCPDYPHHTDILDYYERYVDHFGFRQTITFETVVQDVRPCAGGYRVTLERAGRRDERVYSAVLVANGHHWSPRMPAFAGTFTGRAFHSFDYKTPEGLEDRRVLVVGIGNSGCDIASEVSRVAAKTYLSTRRGAHNMPKYLFGRPLDRISQPYMWTVLPFRLFQAIVGAALYLSRGRLTRFGLPEPPHRVLEEHPTVAADLLNLIGHGRIAIKSNVERLEGSRVAFADGSREEVDVIIYATGYDIRFPFLGDDILSSERNEVPLYKHVVDPSHPGLYFVGLVQPWGPLNPLAEAQCAWIADLISGRGLLPDEAEMHAEIIQARKAMQARYAASLRHTIQVDFHPYLYDLQRTARACRRRRARARTTPR